MTKPWSSRHSWLTLKSTASGSTSRPAISSASPRWPATSTYSMPKVRTSFSYVPWYRSALPMMNAGELSKKNCRMWSVPTTMATSTPSSVIVSRMRAKFAATPTRSSGIGSTIARQSRGLCGVAAAITSFAMFRSPIVVVGLDVVVGQEVVGRQE